MTHERDRFAGRRVGKSNAELLAAYPSLTAKDLANAWTLVNSFPSSGAWERVEETLAFQSRKLRKARDLLLPRLMDGRIRV